MDQTQFAVHTDPVWRDRADFIINAELPETSTNKRYEQLWARQVSDDEFELCCIPFFLYDVALGDIVRTSTSSDLSHLLSSVVRPSGRYAFRVWFGDAEVQVPVERIAHELDGLGALVEWSSANLIAVDASDVDHAGLIADYLADREQRGLLVYETGRMK